VSEELGEVIVDKETARASCVFLLTICFFASVHRTDVAGGVRFSGCPSISTFRHACVLYMGRGTGNESLPKSIINNITNLFFNCYQHFGNFKP